MFQTEPIHFLQSFANDWIIALMVLVSSMGYPPFYIVIFILITLGVNFRKGLLLIQIVLCVSILTELLKNMVALPRPSDVDSNVKLLGKDYPNPSPLTDMGACGFLHLPDPEAIRLYRSQPEWSFGFPSGHVSSTTTFWGGMSLLFRNTVVWVLAAVIIALMPLSRMYLGRHFLADVLGGLVLAGIVVAVTYPLFIIPTARSRLLDAVRLHLATNTRSLLLLTYLLLLPLLLVTLTPLVQPESAGGLFGVNVAFLVIGLRGLPDDAGTIPKRAGRVILGLFLFVMASFVTDQVIEISSLNENGLWVEFLAGVAPPFFMLWGTVQLSLRTGLYTNSMEVESDAI